MDLERILLLAGVVVVVVVSRFQRRVGGVLGLLLCGGITWWGLNVYSRGGVIGLAGKPLEKTYFLVFVGLFAAYNLFSVWRGEPEKDGGGGGDSGQGG
jgi:hypothetical protein